MKNNLFKKIYIATAIFFLIDSKCCWAQAKDYTYYLTDEGCKIGNTFHSLEKWLGEKFIWSGDCVEGYATGKGKLIRNNGIENMEIYEGNFDYGFMNGYGIEIDLKNKAKFEGDFVNGKPNGKGIYIAENGTEYIGEVKDGKFDGLGIFRFANGKKLEGRWKNNNFIKEEVVNIGNIKNNSEKNIQPIIKNEEVKKNIEINNNVVITRKEQSTNKINLQISNTQPNVNGEFTVIIKTNSDTASLKINGDEQGGREDGVYQIKRIARAGQVTKLIVFAEDVYGNTDTKTIAVNRIITQSNQIRYAELNPAQIKSQPNKDAVAIIIGIADYKNLPRADFANDDARAFYDYAMRGLGVRAENIKLLVDAEADEIEILRAFKTWLPARVKATTDVYLYYSGHGLPTDDGAGLYILPHRADRDFLSDTALQQERINQALQATKAKSVTIFLDSCYSGMARNGQTLLVSARPITLKASAQTFPAEFTVISASTAEQISSSSNELKHGIFSYYLMRGMEGEADANKDGKITAGEMHMYLMDNVARQASLANRVQNPQLAGDANRILVGK